MLADGRVDFVVAVAVVVAAVEIAVDVVDEADDDYAVERE